MVKEQLSIAFLGTLVPDSLEFQNPAFNRSGNMAQSGIVEGLYKQGIKIQVFSSRAIPTYPIYKKLFLNRKVINYAKGILLTIIPTINILFLRELIVNIYVFFAILMWAFKNKNSKRCILVYNIYSPPLPIIHFIGKLTNSKTIAIIYDVGMPPKSLNLGYTRRCIYHLFEFFAKKFIPLLDGRIVITEAIARDYAPLKHYLLMDGGISNNIIERLFPLELKQNLSETIFLCAGSLWSGNGVDFLIDALKINQNTRIKIWFAGSGEKEQLIKKAAEEDSRIVYKGMLNLDELFSLYRETDILLNLRVIPEDEGQYWFPSKFLEYMVVGKLVISTSAVHIQREYGHLCVILERINPQSLSELINEVAEKSNEEKFTKGVNSRQFALDNCTWDSRSKQILNYINDVV